MDKKYYGVIMDRLGSLQERQTRKYATYKAAYDAAWRLAGKHYGDTNRAACTVCVDGETVEYCHA